MNPDNVIPLSGRLPAGATAEGNGTWHPGDTDRVVHARPRELPGRPGVTVHAAAVQRRDGTITDERHVVVGGADAGLTTTQARALAALLIDAANELDTWPGPLSNS
jgi:hypothetical protein